MGASENDAKATLLPLDRVSIVVGPRALRDLPEQPLVRIRPSGKLTSLNVRELWAYRELLFFLTWRDVRVRYKQTVLGVAWAIIQPLLTMVIFTLFFGKAIGVASDGIAYPLFVYAGLLPWTFVSNAISGSGNSLVGSSHLITKVYFPRMIIPSAAVAAGLVDFAIGFTVLIALMVYYEIVLTWTVVLVPLLLLLSVLLALGVGMSASALNVRYRDVRYALPFCIQLWLFATPIIYPSSVVPAQWRWALALNPLTGIIEGYRASLFGRQVDLVALGLSGGLTIALLVGGAYLFRRMEKSFADIV